MTVQTVPATQVVAPVHPIPPHWPHSGDWARAYGMTAARREKEVESLMSLTLEDLGG